MGLFFVVKDPRSLLRPDEEVLVGVDGAIEIEGTIDHLVQEM